MLKKSITYIDYEGNQRTEDFYFNLTKQELAKMNWNEVGGLEKKLDTIAKRMDVPTIMAVFEEIIKTSYGVPSPDGRKFIKNKEVLDDFVQTEAYSELFMELCSSGDAAADFISKIVPKDMRTKMQELKASGQLPGGMSVIS